MTEPEKGAMLIQNRGVPLRLQPHPAGPMSHSVVVGPVPSSLSDWSRQASPQMTGGEIA